ncbi:ANTAR domain-containing protein [Paraburkholderia phymatum]|uniref:ANTAR domain-containing response regulator n=1 Tax=Paraburkholderia phymatum TaxID=148447 RepID=UPI00317C7876
MHKDDSNRRLLSTQLARLGMTVDCRAADDLSPWPLADLCFFDADAEKRDAFPWYSDRPEVPLIAMIGTETPERIQWNLSRGAVAFLVKPVRSNGTYLALMQAEHNFMQRSRSRAELNEMSERVKARRIVFKVLLCLMKREDLNEDQAYDRLRSLSMQQRTSIEALCVAMMSGIPDSMSSVSDKVL